MSESLVIRPPADCDEFLRSDLLTCPVAGCQWRGVKLCQHAAMVHRIKARELKRLLGFNATTSLVTAELRESMRPMGARLSRPVGWSPPRRKPGGRASREARQHRAATMDKREPAVCRRCATPFLRRKGTRRRYCSDYCTHAAQHDKRRARQRAERKELSESAA
jgi:hypothetical protein